jgi:hypothetical protein
MKLNNNSNNPLYPFKGIVQQEKRAGETDTLYHSTVLILRVQSPTLLY